jgi:hypothetical protein
LIIHVGGLQDRPKMSPNDVALLLEGVGHALAIGKGSR